MSDFTFVRVAGDTTFSTECGGDPDMCPERDLCDVCDPSPYGRDGDHCPFCAADWRQPHDEMCRRA